MRRELEDFRIEVSKHVETLLRDLQPRDEATQLDHERRLRRIGSVILRVYHGIVLMSGARTLTADPAVVAELRLLARKGVYVFILGEPQSAEWLGEPTIIAVPLGEGEPPAASIGRLYEAIEDIGLRSDRILALIEIAADGASEILSAYEDENQGTSVQYIVAVDSLDAKHIVERERTVMLLPVLEGGVQIYGSRGALLILKTLMFRPRINMRETATAITSGAIRNDLTLVAARARDNLSNARRYASKQRGRATEEDIFDHRCGAVSFRPDDWWKLQGVQEESAAVLVKLFDDRFGAYWQPGRPCLMRALWTPTKILLRGERYYLNMRNTSPLQRIRLILEELECLCSVRHVEAASSLMVSTEFTDQWKLVLGFLDQLRNIGLQLFGFAHAAKHLADQQAQSCPAQGKLADLTRARDEAQPQLHAFLEACVQGYYAHLMCEPEAARRELARAYGVATNGLLATVRGACDELAPWLRDLDRETNRSRIAGLVRRWREADHPGENVLVALSALESVPSASSYDAVGIGWGGIEIPLVNDYLVRHLAPKDTPRPNVRIHIANFSHYRDPGAEIYWVSLLGTDTEGLHFDAGDPFVFDDNVLTGITLEKLRDIMVLMGANAPRLHVIRFSGERRWAQMRMPNHGAVDPKRMLTDIDGYLGETAFARSWSAREKEYVSPIGVFSLARRRILECIHNNSTVEAWDREGF